jgi:hypothetical protein
MDLLPPQERLQYGLQDLLHRHLRLHHIPDDKRLQANTRPESGHIQSLIPAGRERGHGDIVSIPLLGF